jgi:hypothetical protein
MNLFGEDEGTTPYERQEVEKKADPLDKPATDKQWRYIRGLGYRGPCPRTKREAGEIIARLKKDKK